MTVPNIPSQIIPLLRALDDSDYDAAKAPIENLLAALPGEPQVERLVGSAFFRFNRMEEARQHLSTPGLATAADIQEMLVTAAKAARDMTTAKTAARRGVLLAPDNPKALRDCAELSYRAGRLARVFKLACRLGYLEPSNGQDPGNLVSVLSRCSTLRYDQCALEDAERLSRLALVLCPGIVDLLAMRREILTDLFDRPRAEQNQTRAHLIAAGHEAEYPALVVLSSEMRLFEAPSPGPLGARVMTGALVVPLHHDLDVGGLRAGVFDASGEPQDDALLRWNNRRLVHQATPRPSGDTLAGEYIFGGFLIHQFGHFVLETLARYWYARQNPDLPIIFLGPINNSPDAPLEKRFLNWERSVFDFLGIGLETPRLILETVTIERLHLPDAGIILRDTFFAEQIEALGRFRTIPVTKGRKLWLSRSGGVPGDIDNEAEIEARLAEDGWEIACLHELNFIDQLTLLAESQRVAGFAASAFHNLVFLDKVRARIDIFSRNNRRFQTAETIAREKGFEQVVHYPRMSKSIAKTFAAVDPSEVLGVLRS